MGLGRQGGPFSSCYHLPCIIAGLCGLALSRQLAGRLSPHGALTQKAEELLAHLFWGRGRCHPQRVRAGGQTTGLELWLESKPWLWFSPPTYKAKVKSLQTLLVAEECGETGSLLIVS